MFLFFLQSLAVQAPASKWTVDFADAHCEARRSYGAGPNAMSVAIRPPLDPAASTRLTFDRPIREISGQLEKAATIEFGDGAPPFRTFLQPTLGPDGFRYLVDLPEAQARRLRDTAALELKTSARVGGRFELAPTQSLFKALDRCIADLRKRVGLDSGAAEAGQPATPSAPLKGLFSSSRFWTAEFHSSKTNRVTVSLLIDKSGAVRDCSVVTGTGSAALDTQTCQVFLRQVRFAPARNASGETVASLQHQSVEWRR